ncbi:hypothetical protein SDC9_54952 [bioreactor metagenome]|uniref:Peptidylprolyl isomerase n=1 Tax=bioreactor metagenome TaxID=1076179 RepID=A0A644WYU0_9ZZZZ
MRHSSCIVFSALVLLLISCGQQKSSDRLLAEVNGEKLYLSGISVPPGLSSEDSVAFVKNMVQTWVGQQLMYQDADSKLSDEAKAEIEQQIERTRKLMIISALEEQLVSDSVKMQISSDEIQNYYREHPDEFLLKENIVKVKYLKLKKKGSDVAKFKSLLQSDKLADQTELASKAREEALNYFLEDNVWMYFNDILKEIPIKAENQEDFLKSNKFYELSNDSIAYLVRFNGYLLSESPAPLTLVKDRIESVLIAKKKNMLLDDYRNKMYENALKEKKVTLYLD